MEDPASSIKQSSSLNEMLHLILSHAKGEEEAVAPLSDEDTLSAMPFDTFWADMFAEFFLNPSPNFDISAKDDMLFFVCQIYNPVEKPRLEVYRRGSPRIPIVGHPGYNWQETLYLNIIMQQFEYFLTLAICTRSGQNELEVLRKHTITVYASPSRRQLDSKGTGEEIIYPQIFFIVDNFEEIFRHMTVGDGELVCVELVAHNKRASFSSVIFLGSVRYEVLFSAYQAKKSTMSSRFSLFSARGNTAQSSSSSYAFSQDFISTPSRLEFVKMRGPHNKGSAEVAVTAVVEPTVSLSRRFAGSMSLLASFVGSNDNRGGVDKSNLRKSMSTEVQEDWMDRQHQGRQIPPQQDPGGSAWISRSFSQAFSMFGRKQSADPVQPTQFDQTNQARSRLGTLDNDPAKSRQKELHTFLTYVSLPWQNIVDDILEPSAKPVLTTI